MLGDLYRRHQEAFDRYQALLLKWNEKINLTALTSPEEIQEKHFLDSLALLPALDSWLAPKNVSRETFLEGRSLLDIGSGGGFPGIPLKIVVPSLKVVLVDSVRKKCDFLKEVIRALSLKEIEVRHLTLSSDACPDTFDLVVSRAAFSLTDFLKLGAPCLNSMGWMVAYKGMGLEKEIQEAEGLRQLNHFLPFESYLYKLPLSQTSHQLLLTRHST
jgi:16S rRNA (guanine527-N7)-methyltransferase